MIWFKCYSANDSSTFTFPSRPGVGSATELRTWARPPTSHGSELRAYQNNPLPHKFITLNSLLNFLLPVLTEISKCSYAYVPFATY